MREVEKVARRLAEWVRLRDARLIEAEAPPARTSG